MNRLHFSDIVAHIEKNRRTFSAPYGVIEGTGVSKSGRKHKNVTFGVARFLDAHIAYYSPNFIVVTAHGALESRFQEVYRSIEDLIAALDAIVARS
jgi:hypothetical protein